MKDVFSSCHPIVNLYYFVVVLAAGMMLSHPVFLTISLVSGCVYGSMLMGFQDGVWRKMKLFLPMTVLVICINTLFNHYGVTLLFYLPNGNRITLEAAVYGLVTAVMLASVLIWFSCYGEIMTTDKFIYLFGRILPGLSLIFSMCLRFIPAFSRQAKKIGQARKCIGRDSGGGNVRQRLKYGMENFSILTTWGLENGVDTADSMRARGYGLPGRTAFSIFYFDTRDGIVTAYLTILLAVFLYGIWNGAAYVEYNPAIAVGRDGIGLLDVITWIAYLLFCFCPVMFELLERRRWAGFRAAVEKSGEKGVRLWEYSR